MSLSILSNPTNHAVKALIYREDGKILLQQRDENVPGLPYPGHWTFFGGLVESGESFVEALKRELLEELTVLPGQIGEEIFYWEWKSDWTSTGNHYFPVPFTAKENELKLQEGKDLGWFTFNELINLPLTPAVFEIIFELFSFLKHKIELIIEDFEKILLNCLNLTKKNKRVLYARQNPILLNRKELFFLKALADLNETPIMRVCLHVDDTADVHEMLMIHTRPLTIGPLKQNKTSLSYHLLEGVLEIKQHDAQGSEYMNFVLSKDRFGECGGLSLRLKASDFRSIHSRSPYTIFVEVASGPFKDDDTVWFANKDLEKPQ